MFKVLKSNIVYQSNWLRLYEEVLDTGNNNHTLYNKITTFDTAHVFSIFEGKLLMVENYRHAVGECLFELPGGFIDPGEKPIESASRELLEETGYAAGMLDDISSFYTWPGRCTQKNYLFGTNGLIERTGQTYDSFETVSVLKLSKEEVFHEMRDGKIKGSPTVTAIFMGYQFYDRKSNQN